MASSKGEIREISQRNRLDAAGNLLDQYERKEGDSSAKVLVVGLMNVGKSHLLNSLVEQSSDTLLPVAATRTTACVTVLAPSRGNVSYFKTVGLQGRRQKITRQEFQELARAPNAGEDVRALSADVPARFLEELDGVLVDAPGFGSLTRADTTWVLEYLRETDAVVYCVDIKKGIAHSDLKWISEEITDKGRISRDALTVVLTQRDTYYESIDAKLRQARETLEICGFPEAQVMWTALSPTVPEEWEGLDELRSRIIATVREGAREKKLASLLRAAWQAATEGMARKEAELHEHGKRTKEELVDLEAREAESLEAFRGSVDQVSRQVLDRVPVFAEDAVAAFTRSVQPYLGGLRELEFEALFDHVERDEPTRKVGWAAQQAVLEALSAIANAFADGVRKELKPEKDVAPRQGQENIAGYKLRVELDLLAHVLRYLDGIMETLRLLILPLLKKFPLLAAVLPLLEGLLPGLRERQQRQILTGLGDAVTRIARALREQVVALATDRLNVWAADVKAEATALSTQAVKLRRDVEKVRESADDLIAELAQVRGERNRLAALEKELA